VSVDFIIDWCVASSIAPIVLLHGVRRVDRLARVLATCFASFSLLVNVGSVSGFVALVGVGR